MAGLSPPARLLALWAYAATIALVVLACTRSSDEAAARPTERIVSVGGAVTETLFALGAGPSVVAVDTSSVFPAAATALPQVGYQRSLAAEPILALRPTLIIAAPEAGPPSALDQLRAAGVRVEIVGQAHSPEATVARTRAIAAVLGADGQGAVLAEQIGRGAAAASERARARARRVAPRVAFVYARGGGNVMVSGSGTAASAMLTLAGAVNAVDGYEGFKPLSAEAMVAAQPDAILVLARGLEAAGGMDGVLAIPGVAETPAGKARRVVVMDDLLLLGFGPRLPEAIDELSRLLAGEPS
jgi:iron complex transport system substrate-binding protein